tara:strand:+ start:942 stop:1256 length:315 start_codon:yes stop_codon:yes gene_type:complete
MKDFYQESYSVSMFDMMDIWIETFHPFGTVLVLWDVATHFEVLKDCGILVNSLESYDSKAVTIVLPGVLEAYEVMDNIEKNNLFPIMQVYHNSKLLSDNIEAPY